MEAVQVYSPQAALAVLDAVKRGEREIGQGLVIQLVGSYFWGEVPSVVVRSVDQARSWSPLTFNWHGYQATVGLAEGRLPPQYLLSSQYEISRGVATLSVTRRPAD